MLSVAEARAAILAGVRPTAPEWVDLRAAHGRVLAADLPARLTQPPFDTTSMDGYAVHAADTGDGARLLVCGQSAAGGRHAGPLGPGETVRIFTGAPLPAGADAVIPQERVSVDGGSIVLAGRVPPGAFVRRAGLDFAAGATGLGAGRRLDARALALAAAMNHARLPLRRKPIVALMANGDELVPPGTPPGADQIVSSSFFAVRATLEAAGAEVIDLGIARDDLDDMVRRLRAGLAAPADVVVTLGGASVGDRDLSRAAFARLGMTPGFWTIAMRPGKPLVFGTLGTARILGLPGNPVSAYACCILFAVPLVRALQGLAPGPVVEDGILGADVGENDAREDYLRASIETGPDGRARVTAYPVQDSSMQAILAAANGFLVRAPHEKAAQTGENCRFLRLPD